MTYDLTLSDFLAVEDLFAESDVHNATRWQIDTLDGDFSAPVWDSGWDEVNLTSTTSADLDEDAYQARAKVRDDLYVQSEWSDSVVMAGAGWRITFFEADDLTPILGDVDEDGTVLVASFHTSAFYPRPYMQWPRDISDAEAIFAEGKMVIGAMTVGVMDYPLDEADQTTGIVTSIIDRMQGSRCAVDQWDSINARWVRVLEGETHGISNPSDTITRYDFSLRDIGERERKIQIFDRNETYSVYPEGVIGEYGKPVADYTVTYPGGTITGASIKPTALVHEGTFFQSADADGRRAGLVRTTDRFNDLTDAAIEAGEPGAVGLGADGERSGWPNITLRWRPSGGGDLDWTYLRGMRATGGRGGNYFDENAGGGGTAKRRNPVVVLRLEGPDEDMPAASAAIEVQALAARTTELTPAYYQGTFGALLKAIYDGDLSDSAPRMAYNEARMAELVGSTPLARLKRTEPVKDAREWLEKNWYAPMRMVAGRDEDGRIYPIRYDLPSEDEGIPTTLTDALVARDAEADWDAGRNAAVNEVEFIYVREQWTYYGERAVAWYVDNVQGTGNLEERANAMAAAPWETFYDVAEQEVREVYRATDRRGNKVTYEPETVRSVGAINGEHRPDAKTEVGAQIARECARVLLDRFPGPAYGITLRARADQAEVNDMALGQWVVVQLSWLPDPTTGERGCDRIAQVVRLGPPESDGFRPVGLIDGGPNQDPLGYDGESAAVLSAPYFDGARASIDVEGVPAGLAVRVDVRVVDPTHDPDPAYWMLGRTEEPDTMQTYPLDFQQSAEFRYRIEGAGRQPTAWIDAGSIGPLTTPNLRWASADADAANGEITVRWEQNAALGGVRIYYAIHAESELAPDPLVDFVDAEIMDGALVLPERFDAASNSQRATIDVEPWTEYPIAGESGDAIRAVARWRGTGVFTFGDAAEWSDALEVAKNLLYPVLEDGRLTGFSTLPTGYGFVIDAGGFMQLSDEPTHGANVEGGRWTGLQEIP